MPKTSALDTLIELATTDSDEAAKRLGRILKVVEDAEKKLAMLVQYADDYRSRLANGTTAGMTAAGYRNFQAFLDKLDVAIAGQQKVVAEARQRAEAERGRWQEAERKRLSYGTLAVRAEKVEQARQDKRDQKLMDEHATRQAHYKR